MNRENLIIGIDISKTHLDIAVGENGTLRRIEHNEPNILSLVEEFQKLQPTLIVAEATGGLERILSMNLAHGDLPIVVVNPRHVRNFTKAVGQLAKTDAIDARMLARYGAAIKPDVRPIKDESRQHLADQISRRRQITKMISQEKNRLQQALVKDVSKDIKAHITYLQKRLNAVDSQIKKTLDQSHIFKKTATLLITTPGIGIGTASTLIACCPELGSVSNKEIAALVGVAPFNRDSGFRRGPRMVWGGRATVRSQLYMATISAIRCNPAIRTFYRRLVDAGKKPKVAITACMRKMIVTLNSMVRSNTEWNAHLDESLKHSCC